MSSNQNPEQSGRAPSPDAIAKFIARWSAAQAAERANYQLFLSELCDVLDVTRPDPATDDTAHNAYVFERAVTFHHRGSAKTTTGRIDLYKRGSFVLEAKQYATTKTESATLDLDFGDAGAKSPKIARGTAAWDRAMLEALGQAERYARALPADEDPPPFLLVVDVGHVIELYADFTQKGKNYLPFPDARAHRILLADLARPEVRDTLRAVWAAPLSLDPAKKAAAVTREVAGYLAELARSFEKHHEPKLVAEFLSRCLFCMFAEDVGLLPKDGFYQLLESVKSDPGSFVPMLELLFEDMNQGRFSGLLKKKLLYFNGGLFASARALPVNGTQLGLLRRAAALEWRHVEPAIFGTLLERALHPEERHKLGAHYTPRAYVERLLLPTVIEPLREEWAEAKTAAIQQANDGELKKAVKTSANSSNTSAPSPSSTPPAAPETSSTSPSNASNASKAKSTTSSPSSPTPSSPSNTPASPSTPTSSAASKSAPAPPPSPTSSSGSATSNGTSAPTAYQISIPRPQIPQAWTATEPLARKNTDLPPYAGNISHCFKLTDLANSAPEGIASREEALETQDW